ncbi:MAG: preprotein translocase subunit SecG [Acutalibacteraceae bacterium]
MGVVEIIFGIILLLFSIAIILVVLLQEGHQQNVGAVMGGADTFLSKNKSRSVDAFLPLDEVYSAGLFRTGHCDQHHHVFHKIIFAEIRLALGGPRLAGMRGFCFAGGCAEILIGKGRLPQGGGRVKRNV